MSAHTARLLRGIAWGWTVAALGVLVFVASRVGLPHDPERGDLGRALENLLGTVLLVGLVAGLLLSARWPVVGAVVIVTSAVLSGVYASIQYSPVIEVLVSTAFIVPGLLLLVAGWRRGRSVLFVGGVGALLLAMPWAGYHAAWRVYDHYTGPAHPQSPLAAAPVSTIEWAWAGATTGSSFTVKAKLARPAEVVRLVVRAEGERRPVEPVATAGPHATGMVVTLTATRLEPGRRYRYDVEVDGETDPARAGEVATFPDGPADFSLVFGSCATTASSGAVFDRMRELDPLLFLHLGDLHYADLAGDDDSARRSTMDRVLAAPAQAALYRSTTTAYVWDDHDFLGNDRGGLLRPAAGSALRVYRELVPHYPLPLGDGGPVAQAFTIGRVRFVVTDPRAGRDREPADGSQPTMLGPSQRAWLEDELRDAAGRHAAVVWANPVPWIDPAGPGKDTWGGFAEERQELADLVASLDVPLLMLSGDAHMIAIDDGTNSDYSSGGEGGFPVFHAAALDRRGSVKGGPYSHGAFPGPGQFGHMAVRDDGARIAVEWSGRDWRGREVVQHRFELRAPDR